MTRAWQISFLALAGMLALSFAGVNGAEAAKLTAGSYPVRLTGTDLGTKAGEFTRVTFGNGARYVECSTATLEGTLSAESETIIATPASSGCFSNGLTTVPATWTWNGCSWSVSIGFPPSIQLTLTCPEGKHPEVHIYANHTSHTESKPLCSYEIPPQGPFSAGTRETANAGTATEDLILRIKTSGLKVTNKVGSAILCGIGAGAEGTATISGNVTTTGETDNANKEHRAIMTA